MTFRVHQLTLHKGGRCLLDVPQLDLPAGQVHALLGPNGAGKSTLLKALSGMERSVSDRVMLNGRSLSQWDILDLAAHRALLDQDHHVPFDFNVTDIVRMGRYPHGGQPHPREPDLVAWCLQLTGALHLLKRRYEQLSGGEKARVQLARVLAQIQVPPDDCAQRWLLLDEPTAALDLAHQHAVMRLLRDIAAQGVGVLVVLHDINLAGAYADQVLVMSDGRIDTRGQTADVLQPQMVARIWGVVCERLARPDQARVHEDGLRGWFAFS